MFPDIWLTITQQVKWQTSNQELLKAATRGTHLQKKSRPECYISTSYKQEELREEYKKQLRIAQTWKLALSTTSGEVKSKSQLINNLK